MTTPLHSSFFKIGRTKLTGFNLIKIGTEIRTYLYRRTEHSSVDHWNLKLFLIYFITITALIYFFIFLNLIWKSKIGQNNYKKFFIGDVCHETVPEHDFSQNCLFAICVICIIFGSWARAKSFQCKSTL